MAKGQKNVFSCAANFLRGRKCVFCGSFKVNRTRRGYAKCRKCRLQKSLKQLRREIAIVKGFYQAQPAYRLANDLNLNYQTVTRVYQKLREAVYHVAELEGSKLSGEIEIDESYFCGRLSRNECGGAKGYCELECVRVMFAFPRARRGKINRFAIGNKVAQRL